VAEPASDVPCVVEGGSDHRDVRVSSYWALLRLDIEEEGRLVIVVVGAVVGPVLSIQGQLYRSLPPVIGWRGYTNGSSRVQDSGGNPHMQGCEGTLGAI
jgi:hypothetical protein